MSKRNKRPFRRFVEVVFDIPPKVWAGALIFGIIATTILILTGKALSDFFTGLEAFYHSHSP